MMIAFVLLAQADEATVTLEPAGLVLMVLSITMIIGLAVFCSARILREKRPSEHHHAPLDIDTHDVEP